MTQIKEEKEILIKDTGEKVIHQTTVVYNDDGDEIARSVPKTKTVMPNDDVPQDITDFIEAKKGKQSKK